MKIGILAFGSLIDDPGDEIAAAMCGIQIPVRTPFGVEYGRLSSSRRGAPTLVPHALGGVVSARILSLATDCSEEFAMDILYRREIHAVGSSSKYTRSSGPNCVLVKPWRDFHGFDVVFFTDFYEEGKIKSPTPQSLAMQAVGSVGLAEAGKDGITYLANNIQNGIHTPLTSDYESEILKQTGVIDLQEALKICLHERF
jgi:hypothetical protein